MTIRAGKADHIKWKDGSWVFADLGFAKAENKTCGVLIGDEKPKVVCFSKACELVREHIEMTPDAPVNLVLEAPLSVAFDRAGNPKGRSIERRKGKQRYWYLQAGIVVMVAAQYMIKQIKPATEGKKLRLFEGFVSFKQKKSDHSKDVLLLRDIVWNPESSNSRIIAKTDLKMDPTDKLSSAFTIHGSNYGVSPVLIDETEYEADTR